MQKLLSLPECLASQFQELTGTSAQEWFAASDPKGSKIGSGGGTAYLLAKHSNQDSAKTFEEYLSSGKKIVVHAGGQSRRLPSYAPLGKVLAPVPVFRWSMGQRIDQTLLDLQMPLLEKMMEKTLPGQNVMIAAGDVLIQSTDIPDILPDTDIVCFGIWVDPHLASRHGVFFTSRTDPQQLDFMLQKPGHQLIEKLSDSHLYLMDIGIWILSNRAVQILMRKTGWNGKDFTGNIPAYYDLYGSFGTCLGENPSGQDEEIRSLTTSIVSLNAGEFYHFGTSEELISSNEKIQNKVLDQRNIWHHKVKPHPALFVQNAVTDITWTSKNHHIWIENSHVPATWLVTENNIVTGIPENDWVINLQPGLCVDIVPESADNYCVRPYGIGDTFRGEIGDEYTLWMGITVKQWFKARGISFSEAGLKEDTDLQHAPLFPVAENTHKTGQLLKWMLHENEPDQRQEWLESHRLSADDICSKANLKRMFAQRENFRRQNLGKLAANYRRSIFYQTDLKDTAVKYAESKLELPQELALTEPALLRCRDHMFRSEVLKIRGLASTEEEKKAFAVLQASITETAPRNLIPKINISDDQIVWGRSPARLDLAGGWSDTPPYCIQNGGSVLNMGVELNGQPPIQVFIRLCPELSITLRSIDNGVSEVITSYEQLRNYQQVGSAFSIPKAALYLAGFHPDFCGLSYKTLAEQLKDFGGGFEISLLAAIPKGSGLGTSSILAATMLGTLSDFCSLNWDHRVICHRTLILEQLLTTGGGWQDQYGGILPGIKLLESEPGVQEKISVRWMPDLLFTQTETRDNWLLYYTGITRVAKNILAEIVRGMFLNEGPRLRIVDEIRQHAWHLAEALQRSDYQLTGNMVARSWKLNNALDSGTNTPEIQYIINKIQDYSLGYKLLGAGGGGYMLIAAKDNEAAVRIQSVLSQHSPDPKARFVKMEVSLKGFQVSRS
jgi:galactokinase/mevalonate kinase-like predicted kinase